MKPLSQAFTAREIYVTVGDEYHSLKTMTVKDWRELDDKVREIYPEYDCIEFATFEVDEDGWTIPNTIEEWMIEWKHSMRILFRAEDFE